MLAFCCTHIATGSDVWGVTRSDATDKRPESIDVTCRICTGLPEASFTVDDIVVLDTIHLADQLERLLK